MKNQKPYSKKSSVLLLWCIGIAIVIFLTVSQVDHPATGHSLDSSTTSRQESVLPTLVPEALVSFDPVHHLIRVHADQARMHKATVELADVEYDAMLRRIELAAQKSVLHGETLFYPIIFEAAYRYEVDPAIVKAIILAESSYNPRAVSKVGAQGLMQLMPITAKEMGVENSFNPQQNIHGGTAYFKKLLTRYDGNVKLALAAYNAGSGKVQRYRGIPPYKATRTYIRKVLQYHRNYSQQSRKPAIPPTKQS